MRYYECFENLERSLSDAADEVISCSNAYDSEWPCRFLISDLTEQHGFDERYAPLLVAMLNERSNAIEFETVDDEIFAYRDRQEENQNTELSEQPNLPYTAERMKQLLNNALDWIGGQAIGSALYNILIEEIDMTEEEITAAGFDLEECYDKTNLEIDQYTDASLFTERMLKIPGINSEMLPNWIQHTFDMAILDEDEGVPQAEAREMNLNLFAETFEKIEHHYGGAAAAIFNFKAGYVAHELYGAAAFIADGGDPAEAYEMASNGAFEDSVEPDDDEEPVITM